VHFTDEPHREIDELGALGVLPGWVSRKLYKEMRTIKIRYAGIKKFLKAGMCPPKGKTPPPPPPPEPVAPPPSEESGILNFDAENCVVPPKFTDPLTVLAMNENGIVPDDLVKLSQEYIRKIPGKPEVRDRIVKELETRRLNAIAQIKATREELVKQEQQQTDFASNSHLPDASAAAEREIRRQERMQQREVEQLLTAELRRQREQAQELERQKQMAILVQQQEEARRKALAEGTAKRKERESKVIERIQQREVELEDARKKQDEQEIRRRKAEEELQVQRKAEAVKQEKEKEERLKKLAEEQKRREVALARKRDEDEGELRKREAVRLEAKAEELRKAKEEHEAQMQKQRDRVVQIRRKEVEMTEQKITKFEENEKVVLQRVSESQRRRDESLSQLRRRNEDKVARARSMIEKIEQDDLEKKQAISVKTTEAAARLQLIVADRNRRMELARKGENEKSLQALDRKARSEDLLSQRLGTAMQKQAATDARLAELKKKAEEDATTKAADQWLRMKIGEENARRLERKQEWQRQQALKKMEDKAQAVELMTQQKRDEEERRRRQSAALAEKKKQLIAEFAAKMDGKGRPNVDALAKEFGIDVAELNQRVSSPDRSGASSKLSDGETPKK
jgi:hypothetical protein